MRSWFTLDSGSRRCARRLDAFVESTQKNVTGTVTLSLYKGQRLRWSSRKSEFSLYRTDLSSFTMGDSYDQKDAAGFIRILGLPSRSARATPAGGDEVKMWSGRFRQPLDPEFERWQRSFPFDQCLLPYELEASRAHAHALEQAGVLSSQELSDIERGLVEIGKKARVCCRVPRR